VLWYRIYLWNTASLLGENLLTTSQRSWPLRSAWNMPEVLCTRFLKISWCSPQSSISRLVDGVAVTAQNSITINRVCHTRMQTTGDGLRHPSSLAEACRKARLWSVTHMHMCKHSHACARTLESARMHANTNIHAYTHTCGAHIYSLHLWTPAVVHNRIRKTSQAVDETCIAIFWPTPGYRGRIVQLWVNNRRDRNFCVGTSPLRCLPHSKIKSFHGQQNVFFSPHEYTFLNNYWTD